MSMCSECGMENTLSTDVKCWNCGHELFMNGQKIIDAIIKGSLCKARCAHDESHACVVVWSSGAAEQLDAACGIDVLKDANELCRSAMEIAKRKGRDTNWQTFREQLDASLKRQHAIIYPSKNNESHG